MSLSSMTNIFASLIVPVAAVAHAAPVPAPAIAEAQLRAINHRFVNAFAVADGEYIDKLTATDFLLTSTTGDWIERAQHVERMRNASVNGSVSYDDVSVRLFGSVAVLHGVFDATATMERSRAVRCTDVYHWNGSNWRLVNAQNTALRDGVAKLQHTGKAPVATPWQGADPSAGDDDVALRMLNANYVRAFRDADVAWYDAHLSNDYGVINSDGSFHDRARALAEFAKPVFATSIRSFPVDKVRVRRFDDVALIHAENDFELKDGRKGINRYTDIWHKQPDGRWRCVAAHITTFKAVS